jgi:hypothetical protein
MTKKVWRPHKIHNRGVWTCGSWVDTPYLKISCTDNTKHIPSFPHIQQFEKGLLRLKNVIKLTNYKFCNGLYV